MLTSRVVDSVIFLLYFVRPCASKIVGCEMFSTFPLIDEGSTLLFITTLISAECMYKIEMAKNWIASLLSCSSLCLIFHPPSPITPPPCPGVWKCGNSIGVSLVARLMPYWTTLNYSRNNFTLSLQYLGNKYRSISDICRRFTPRINLIDINVIYVEFDIAYIHQTNCPITLHHCVFDRFNLD